MNKKEANKKIMKLAFRIDSLKKQNKHLKKKLEQATRVIVQLTEDRAELILKNYRGNHNANKRESE